MPAKAIPYHFTWKECGRMRTKIYAAKSIEVVKEEVRRELDVPVKFEIGITWRKTHVVCATTGAYIGVLSREDW